MNQQKPPFPLRMPKELREWLEAKTAKSHRSLNAEIVVQLNESMSKESIQESQK